MNISNKQRFSSSFSDFITRYTAVSSTNMKTQTTEYYALETDDVLRFSGGHADEEQITCITSLTLPEQVSDSFPHISENIQGVDYGNKDTFNWISVIRLPDFVTQKDFEWAVETATKKKKLDCSKAEFLTIDEGLCVQMMHIGPFDNEPESVTIMDAFLEERGYENDINKERLHHEIYMSDARKVAPEKWKTVIRHPIRRK